MRVSCVVELALLLLLGSVGGGAAQASAEQGEDVFKKCKTCHDIGEGAIGFLPCLRTLVRN
jgi:cytochrome c2